MPRLLIHFARYGPYHHARLRTAAAVLEQLDWEVIGLETSGTDCTYAWDEIHLESDGPRIFTAFPGRVHEEITAAEYRSVLFPLLQSLGPDAMAIAGWGSKDAQLCLAWCRKNEVRSIVMSETREADGRRVWWKEKIKRYLISRFDAALVGGRSHRDYLVKLGMPADKIQFGYNVVDNAYFAAEGEKWRRKEAGDGRPGSGVRNPSTPPYFLASNRFIERKNLSRLITAYSAYIQQSTLNSQLSTLWNLCLLGDGELRADLIAQCHQLSLGVIESAPWDFLPPIASSSLSSDYSTSQSHLAPIGTSGPARRSSPTVFFPGFRQIGELPRFYAHAGCFVHPALEEPWGLVLNEAMACGLPVLSGINVGAAEELVDDGVNGWCFDANVMTSIAECLGKVAELDEGQRLAKGAASWGILEERCPIDAFARGLAAILER